MVSSWRASALNMPACRLSQYRRAGPSAGSSLRWCAACDVEQVDEVLSARLLQTCDDGKGVLLVLQLVLLLPECDVM